MLERALEWAILAPSSHNSQPWQFRLTGDAVELYADRTRSLPAIDPDDRELIVSCGAALYTLRIAIRHFGFTDTVEILPDRREPNLLARVALGAAYRPTQMEDWLFLAIRHRHTDRRGYAEAAIATDLVAEMQAAAKAEGAWLATAEPGRARERLAALVAEADKIQHADPAFRAEIAKWLRPNARSVEDGVPGYALGLGTLSSYAGPLLFRTFPRADETAATDRDLTLNAPLTAVLGTAADTPADWIAAGQALAAVLLHATSAGVNASFLNQPCEVPALRERVAEACGEGGFPHLMFRLGYGTESLPTPRRALENTIVS